MCVCARSCLRRVCVCVWGVARLLKKKKARLFYFSFSRAAFLASQFFAGVGVGASVASGLTRDTFLVLGRGPASEGTRVTERERERERGRDSSSFLCEKRALLSPPQIGGLFTMSAAIQARRTPKSVSSVAAIGVGLAIGATLEIIAGRAASLSRSSSSDWPETSARASSLGRASAGSRVCV